MSAKPFPEDVFVAHASARAAAIAALGTAQDALDFVRELSGLIGEHKIFVTICAPAALGERNGIGDAGRSAFIGRPLQAKFAGRCAVCASGFGVGAPILYDGDSKRAAHEACGTAGRS